MAHLLSTLSNFWWTILSDFVLARPKKAAKWGDLVGRWHESNESHKEPRDNSNPCRSKGHDAGCSCHHTEIMDMCGERCACFPKVAASLGPKSLEGHAVVHRVSRTQPVVLHATSMLTLVRNNRSSHSRYWMLLRSFAFCLCLCFVTLVCLMRGVTQVFLAEIVECDAACPSFRGGWLRGHTNLHHFFAVFLNGLFIPCKPHLNEH